MKKCILCEGKAEALAKKCSEGVICKNCLSFIPSSVILSQANTDFLKKVHDENMEKSKEFETTASFLGLYIDGIHGLFCYSKKGSRESPSEFKDIYRIKELTEVGLYCTNVKNIGTNSNNVVCDIKFKFKTKDISADYTLAVRKRCSYKIVDNQLRWNEPGELTMFRNMFNQMIDNEILGTLDKLKKIQELNALVSQEEKKGDWAKGVLFIGLDEECSSDLIKAKRNELVKIFHPDRNSEFANTETAAMINDAYKVLAGGTVHGK